MAFFAGDKLFRVAPGKKARCISHPIRGFQEIRKNKQPNKMVYTQGALIFAPKICGKNLARPFSRRFSQIFPQIHADSAKICGKIALRERYASVFTICV